VLRCAALRCAASLHCPTSWLEQDPLTYPPAPPPPSATSIGVAFVLATVLGAALMCASECFLIWRPSRTAGLLLQVGAAGGGR
jgi:hypothetical protein